MTDQPGPATHAVSVVDRAYGLAVEHILSSISEPFAIFDPQGRVLRANIAYRRLTGPAGGAHDASIISYIEPDQQAAFREAIAGLTEASATRAMELRFRIGSEVRVIDAELSRLSPEGIMSFFGRDVTDKQAQQRQQAEIDAARDAIERMGNLGHWRVGRDLRLKCSEGAARILGFDPNAPSPLLTDLADLIHPDDRAGVLEAAKAAGAGRRAVQIGFRGVRPDGLERTIRVAGWPVTNASGQPAGMQGILADKTDGHAAWTAALNSASLVRQFVRHSPIPLCLLDRDLCIAMASPAFSTIFQIEQGAIVGRPLYEVLPWIPEKWRKLYQRSLAGDVSRSDGDAYQLADGRTRWSRWTSAPWRDAAGEIAGVVIAMDDITDNIVLQHQVEASRERMAFGMEMADMMIWELDFERREISVEGDWKQFFPRMPTFDTLQGKGSTIHEADRETMASRWRAHLAGGPPYQIEYRAMQGDGREVWHCATVRILRTVKGAPSRAIAVIQDISAHKRIEAAARAAEQRAVVATAAKSDFLTNMSHEIRTPLNGVLAVSEMLSRSSLDERQGEMVRLILTSGQTLLRVMDDIVEYSRLEAEQVEFEDRPFELERTIRAVCESARSRAEAKGLEFDAFISASLDGVYRGDPLRIGQVIGNLLSNAVKFTEQGSIYLSAGVEDSEDGTRLYVTITDTGVGFAPELAERIFERFEQADLSTSRKFGGLGLGLSIVKRLADLMGGKVSARSTPGQGSTFELILPMPRDRIATLGALNLVHADEILAETTLKDVRLLVAEDNPMNRRVVELLLAQSDVKLVFAENGQEAVDKFQASSFDVVLMDLQMPVMNGLAATRAIRSWEAAQSRIPTPIIALSANASETHVREAKAAGADDHVAKPIVRETLFEAIARYARGGARFAVPDEGDFDLDDLDIAV